jgi:hypothetical protein
VGKKLIKSDKSESKKNLRLLQTKLCTSLPAGRSVAKKYKTYLPINSTAILLLCWSFDQQNKKPKKIRKQQTSAQ